MRWVTITKMIVDVKMKLVDSMVGNGLGDKLRMSVMKMMDNIEKWNDELGLMMKEQRVSNPIVGRVLKHAACSIGGWESCRHVCNMSARQLKVSTFGRQAPDEPTQIIRSRHIII
jgi:hypothetical protein